MIPSPRLIKGSNGIIQTECSRDNSNPPSLVVTPKNC